MKLEFVIAEEEPQQPTLEDVKPDQLFLDTYGRLCQYVTSAPDFKYNIITTSHGELCSGCLHGRLHMPIKAVLNNITGIKVVE